ncbi:acyl-CoA dehydrogenase family protein [Nocardia stercoris]|uniref:Acyl-CoA dehydrogenase n=1 Tax=Nocardia stercoris TaxID=2483361 RepID=A0A3M2LB84_9NOCA|nr:acyl-CoA dehydrogenase [Nocardia stercoris]RMI34819.1 acyl-CoA dehydrogenase [Nocardia stercoris]
MNLELDEDQNLLLDSTDAMLAKHYVPGFRAASADTPSGWSDVVWRAMIDLGLTALPIAEEYDGVGAGPVEAYVAMQALGRHAALEPLLEGTFLPAWLIGEIGGVKDRSELLPRLAAGGEIFAVAHAEPGRSWNSYRTVTAEPDGAGFVLTGVKSPVAHGEQATVLLVTATGPDGTGVYVVEPGAAGSTRTGGRTVDWSRAARIEFDRTPARLMGTPGDPLALLGIAYARARAAICAEAVGLMESGIRDTVAYLKTRKQFGVPLSTFQALNFRAADLYADAEMARSMALWATAMVEAYEEDRTVDVHGALDDAFVYVATNARRVAEEIIQLHGGIGVTFESPISHYAARLTAITQSFGGIAATRRRALVSDRVLAAPSALLHNEIPVAG